MRLAQKDGEDNGSDGTGTGTSAVADVAVPFWDEGGRASWWNERLVVDVPRRG
jgi:hypothetical protein